MALVASWRVAKLVRQISSDLLERVFSILVAALAVQILVDGLKALGIV